MTGRLRLMTRCRVPSDLETVTTVRPDTEVDPRSVDVDPAGVGRIWQAVEQLYRSGAHPAIQLCVRRHGQVLIDRAIGHARGNGPDDPKRVEKTLCTPDTPINLFSASKAVTATVVHLLDERGALHIGDPVAEYVPEFGAHGKDRITLRQLLNHRAGIPALPSSALDLNLLQDRERILELLCDLKPVWEPGRRLGYHAISGGFVLAEVVRRATGRSIEQVLSEEIAEPLGFRWMRYGVSAEDVPEVAHNYFTGLPVVPPLSLVVRRALGIDLAQAVELSNDPRFLTAVIPSANVVANAGEVSRFFQLLLDGGELDGRRILESRTLKRAVAEQSYMEPDLTLVFPVRYGLGYILGARHLSLYGPDTERAFGHLGLLNILCWADPARGLSVALMNTGKPLVYPQLYFLWEIARRIGAECRPLD